LKKYEGAKPALDLPAFAAGTMMVALPLPPSIDSGQVNLVATPGFGQLAQLRDTRCSATASSEAFGALGDHLQVLGHSGVVAGDVPGSPP